MRGDPDGPPAVWDIGHMGYREDTSQEICCSGFDRPKGDTRNFILEAHPEFNPKVGDTLQIVCTSAPLASREGDCVLLGTSHLAGRFDAQNGAHDATGRQEVSSSTARQLDSSTDFDRPRHEVRLRLGSSTS